MCGHIGWLDGQWSQGVWCLLEGSGQAGGVSISGFTVMRSVVGGREGN